jgi:hypothetical protein
LAELVLHSTGAASSYVDDPRSSRNLYSCRVANQRIGPSQAPAADDSALRSPGQPLGAGLRRYFESRLMHDLSAVRIHTDSAADRSARDLGAAAYTLGNGIVFQRDRYAPDAPTGRRILAHELIHVLQQAGEVAPPGFGRESAVRGLAMPGAGFRVTPDRSGLLRRIPIEGLPPKTDLANEQMRALDRQRAGVETGPGLSWDEIKKAGYDYLIEQAAEWREWYVASLRERASGLPTGLQPTAMGFMDVVGADLMLLTDLLFFDLALVVGAVESLVAMVTGLLTIILKIIEVALH